MAEKISVIVPAYNAGKQLERCVNSIEAQTYPDVEVIIVDDGSKDNTGDVIRALQEKYGNIVTVNTGDRDICVTRNAGLSLVTGKYFAFVDADDYVRPELLEVLHAVLQETQADVAGCSFYSWTEETGPDAEGASKSEEMGADGSSISRSEVTGSGVEGAGDADASPTVKAMLSQHPAKKYSPDAYLREQVFGKNNSRCWSKLYRREAVGDLDFDEETLVGEDLLFLVKLLGRGAVIAETDYKGYGYFTNPGGAMLRPFSRRYMTQIGCWEKVRAEAEKIDAATAPSATRGLLMAIMLTAGKLAELGRAKKKDNQDCIRVCHDAICRELDGSERGRKGFSLLSPGYRLKCRLFKNFPKLYLGLYHFHKYFS